MNDNVARARISINLELPITGSGGNADDGGSSTVMIGLSMLLGAVLVAGVGLRMRRVRNRGLRRQLASRH